MIIFLSSLFIGMISGNVFYKTFESENISQFTRIIVTVIYLQGAYAVVMFATNYYPSPIDNISVIISGVLFFAYSGGHYLKK